MTKVVLLPRWWCEECEEPLLSVVHPNGHYWTCGCIATLATGPAPAFPSCWGRRPPWVPGAYVHPAPGPYVRM